MQGNAVAHARAVTNAAFAKGTTPAPYYLFVLMRAQAARAQAVSYGAGSTKYPGGTVACQRYTAQCKGPTATRTQWVRRRVTVTRMVRGVPTPKQFWVTTRATVTVVA